MTSIPAASPAILKLRADREMLRSKLEGHDVAQRSLEGAEAESAAIKAKIAESETAYRESLVNWSLGGARGAAPAAIDTAPLHAALQAAQDRARHARAAQESIEAQKGAIRQAVAVIGGNLKTEARRHIGDHLSALAAEADELRDRLEAIELMGRRFAYFFEGETYHHLQHSRGKRDAVLDAAYAAAKRAAGDSIAEHMPQGEWLRECQAVVAVLTNGESK